MDDALLEPLKAYKELYEKQFDENAKNYFDGLVKQSGIDVAQNRKTVKEHKTELANIAAIENKLSSVKTLRGFLIFLAVAGIIMLAVGIYLLVIGNTVTGAVLLSVGAVAAIASIAVICALLNPVIKKNEEQKLKHEAKAKDLLARGWQQMRALNDLFESNTTKHLIESTVPLLKLDDNFDMRRYDYLNGKYGFGENTDQNRSTIAVLSGEILGNPFVVDRELVCDMGTCDYTGTLVIHWTTTYTDSNGKTQTRHHTQTLVATVTKPKPYYSEQTRLIYGNDAAPDLCFTHEPSHAEDHSEKSLENKVKKGSKKIRKLQQKSMQNGGASFTEMGNEEFDVLFGALDRNNDVQFRLLFTPLAQKNMLELMKDDYAFGDDFYFAKRKCLNFVSSEHSREWDLETYYKRYQSYDVDAAFSEFTNFNRNYFKSLYFELAPLLCIPLYQQHKPKEYIYRQNYKRNYTSYEAEYAANKIGQGAFMPPRAATSAILKTRLIGKDGESDKVTVTAYSYRAENRVDYVAKLGGDGMIHHVPVHWVEYIPISSNSVIGLKQIELSDKELAKKLSEDRARSTFGAFGAIAFAHRLLCCKMGANDISFDSAINKVLK